MKKTEENKDWLKYENQAYDNGYEAVLSLIHISEPTRP